jgi:hypothetical protein
VKKLGWCLPCHGEATGRYRVNWHLPLTREVLVRMAFGSVNALGEEAGLVLALSRGGYRSLSGQLALALNKGSAGPYLIKTRSATQVRTNRGTRIRHNRWLVANEAAHVMNRDLGANGLT